MKTILKKYGASFAALVALLLGLQSVALVPLVATAADPASAPVVRSFTHDGSTKVVVFSWAIEEAD